MDETPQKVKEAQKGRPIKFRKMNGPGPEEQTMCEGALNKPSSTALTVLNGLSGMASIGGNLLVLLTIYKQTRLHTISNCFIASLAVADIIVGLVLSPIWATRSAMNIWEDKEPLTIASECLAAHTVVATSLNLCAVSIDRYLAVVKVFRYDTSLSERRCRIIICSIWLAACLALLPRALIQDRLDLQKFWIVGCTITFFIPLCVIAYCYVRIFEVARSQAEKIQVVSVSSETGRKAAMNSIKERKIALTISIIIGLFITLWSPSFVLSSIQTFFADDCLKIKLKQRWFWTALVAFSNSAVNPWVYALRGEEYRSTFRKLLKRGDTNLHLSFYNEKIETRRKRLQIDRVLES